MQGVYDDETEKPDIKPSHDGSHDDLGASPEHREAETADLDNLYNAESSPVSAADGRAEEKEKDKLSDQVGKGFTDDDGSSQKGGKKGRFRVLGKNLLGKKAIFATFAFLLVGSLVIGFLMFIGAYRTEHIRNLLMDYRFARIHNSIAKRIRKNLVLGENYAQTGKISPEAKLRFERTSLYKRMKGFSPEKMFDILGSTDLDIGVSKTGLRGSVGLGENSITSFYDPATGKKTYVQGAKGIPEGAHTVDAVEFRKRLLSATSIEMQRADTTKFFQRQTRKLLKTKVKINFGDRFKRFREYLKQFKPNPDYGGDGYSADDEKKAVRESDIDRSLGGSNPVSGSQIDGEQAREDLRSGSQEPDVDTLREAPSDPVLRERWENKRKSKTFEQFQKGASTWSDISTGVMLATFYCIYRDISNSIDDALTQRIEGPMRLAAGIFGEAEQLKSGDNVETAQLRERSKTLDGTEQSAAFHRINGDTNYSKEDDLRAEDLPFKFFGVDIKTIATVNKSIEGAMDTAIAVATMGLSKIPGISNAIDKAIDAACSQILNPAVQVAITGLDVAALFVSLGGSGAAESVVKVALETLKFVGNYKVSKVVFEYLMPKFVFALAGSGGILYEGDPQNGNKLDLGTTLLAAQTGKMSGLTKISDEQAGRETAAAFADARKQYFAREGIYGIINPHSPYSMVGSISMKLPTDMARMPGFFAARMLSFSASIFKVDTLANLFSKKVYAAEPEFETYGVQQYGIPDSMIDKDPLQNALDVDGEGGQLDEILSNYSYCFDTTLAEEAIAGAFAPSDKDYSKCNDQTAQNLGLYLIDNCSTTFLSDTSTFNNCSLLQGAGDLTGQ